MKQSRKERRLQYNKLYICFNTHWSRTANTPIMYQLKRCQSLFKVLQHRGIFRCKRCDLYSLVALVTRL